jgi:hypothetical protein
MPKGMMEKPRVVEADGRTEPVMGRHAPEDRPSEGPRKLVEEGAVRERAVKAVVKAVVHPKAAVEGDPESPTREGRRSDQHHRTQRDEYPPAKGRHGCSPLLTSSSLIRDLTECANLLSLPT